MVSLFNFLNIVMLSRALFVVADFDVAQLLKNKPMTSCQIATELDCNQDVLNRIMNFLTLHQVFTKNNEGEFYNTDFSLTLCDDHPESVKLFLLHDDPTRWNCYGNLGYCCKTGKAAFDHIYGTDYFSHLSENPLLNQRFNTAMTVISDKEDELIAQNINFQGKVVDIGGGKGQLLSKVKKYNNSVALSLFDLPEVTHDLNCDSSVTVFSGSFFDPLKFDADSFILKRILHDWDDQKAINILTHVADAMDQSSTLYIIEGILDYSNNKQALAAVDLALLAVFQGKERTLQEFENLCNKSGLSIVGLKPLNDIICVLECKKMTA